MVMWRRAGEQTPSVTLQQPLSLVLQAAPHPAARKRPDISLKGSICNWIFSSFKIP